MIGHSKPAAADPTGESFTFEKGAAKSTGGQGWADVWKRGVFAWEYKGKHANLDAAYQQLLQYREALENGGFCITPRNGAFGLVCPRRSEIGAWESFLSQHSISPVRE